MKGTSDKLAFFRQSGWMVLATVAGGVFMSAVHVIVSKPMHPTEYSVFFTLLRVFLLMGFPAGGLQIVFAQQAAAALAEPEQRALAAQTRAVLRATFLIWLGLAMVVFVASRPLIAMLEITNPAALWVTVFLGLASLWAPVCKGLLQGRQQFAGLGWVLILDGVGRFTAIVVIVQLGGQAAGAMTGALIGQVVSLTVGAWLVRHILTAPGAGVAWRPWLRRVVPLTLGVGVVLFMSNFDVIFVQSIFSKEESFLYTPAAMIGLALVTFTTPMAAVMFPKVVRSAAGAGPTDAARKAVIATALLGGMAALACTLLPALPLRIIYFRTPFYWQASPLVPWFAWALLPLILANVLLTNLLARERFRVVPLALAVALGYFGVLLVQKNAMTRFAAADIRDSAALANAITTRADPLAAFIADRLSPELQQRLQTSATDPRAGIAEALNEATQGELIYRPERFTKIALSERVKKLLEAPPTARKDLTYLNRALLHEAYPQAIVSRTEKLFRGFRRVLTTLGAASAVLFAVALGFTWHDRESERASGA